ncbi:hypothetical protein PVL29_025998 [Vitis rotundifolia]|uniref:S-protein homolog n=1 Tax=Vitis rotundifolia TaxID=103349 RepID=A0AA38YLD5_VITRO|nr:hypothetical protein PVL29_025998 [Vitis rotundifolia]
MISLDRFLFSFVLLVFLVRLCDGSPHIENKADVKIINGLDAGTDLNIHCKSKDDDLGAHVLGFEQFFEFHFRPNVWGTTLYFCRFWWNSESHWFDIYDQDRDVGRCDEKCWWWVRAAGACLLNEKMGVYDICEKWKDGGSSQEGTGNDTARIYNEIFGEQ